jgi:polyhydroxybutyrate depolymerase
VAALLVAGGLAAPRSSLAARRAVGRALASGCGLAPRATPGSDYSASLVVAGVTRTYLVHIPADYQSHTPATLVLTFHGTGSTSSNIEWVTSMSTAADNLNVVVAYPQALGNPSQWNTSPAVGGVYAGSQDVAFARAVITTLESQLCVNSSRVFTAGMSDGAGMSFRMACDAGDLVAAFAAVSGYLSKYPCAPSHGQAMIEFHGTADPIIPYNGYGGHSLSVPQLAQKFATTVNLCTTQTVPIFSNNQGVSAIEYRQGCRNSAVVNFYTISGGGHTWPGGRYNAQTLKKSGPVNMSISATQLILTFFSQHPAGL